MSASAAGKASKIALPFILKEKSFDKKGVTAVRGLIHELLAPPEGEEHRDMRAGRKKRRSNIDCGYNEIVRNIGKVRYPTVLINSSITPKLVVESILELCHKHGSNCYVVNRLEKATECAGIRKLTVLALNKNEVTTPIIDEIARQWELSEARIAELKTPK